MGDVDLFAGGGGWDEGARPLGIEPLGIEWDADACATRRAAGHPTLRADVAALDPVEFAPVRGLLGSPPCQSYSRGGKQLGQGDKSAVEACVDAFARGEDERWLWREVCADPRSLLVVEPLRWALALEPEWIAFEQVPSVLPLWEMMAVVLRGRGWNVWTGKLRAEEYGVPQTRERAFLLAHRTRAVGPPPATHQRYVYGQAQRYEATLEGEVLPWVSMAEALGWAPTDRYLNGTHAHRAERAATDPAPTLHFGARLNTVVRQTREEPWGPDDQVGFPRRNDRDDGFEHRARDLRAASEPAFNLTEKARSWTRMRPATTIAGDPRVFQPGGHHANDGRKGTSPETHGRSKNAIRVSLEEASVLQSFRRDYPWQGSRTSRFLQVGNAVPPKVAGAVLGEVCGV